MKNQFVPYHIAKQLSQKGFTENCFAYYNPVVDEGSEPLFLPVDNDLVNFREVKYPCVKAPLWQQVIDWFKTEHNIHIHPNFYTNRIDASRSYEYMVHHMVDGLWKFISISGMNPREIAIYEALKLIR